MAADDAHALLAAAIVTLVCPLLLTIIHAIHTILLSRRSEGRTATDLLVCKSSLPYALGRY
jgi:hypothetical protein